MAIFDTIFGGGQRQAAERREEALREAQERLAPYTEGGAQDYQQYRDYYGNLGQELGQYGSPYEWMWNQINRDPGSFYQDLMEGYNETPMAKYEQEQMMNAVNNAASASGMMGSGAYLREMQDRAADITARDMDRYYQNILGANQLQRDYLGDFRGQQDRYTGGLFNSARQGMEAARGMGEYDQRIGGAQADQETARAAGWNNLVGGLTGGIARLPVGNTGQTVGGRVGGRLGETVGRYI